MTDELGRGWRYQQGPKTGKLKWESVEEKCVTQSTEAVSFPVAVLMESLQFWHVPDEYHFHTFVADMLRLSYGLLSLHNFFLDQRCWDLAVETVTYETESHRRLTISSAPCFAGEAAASEDTKPFLL